MVKMKMTYLSFINFCFIGLEKELIVFLSGGGDFLNVIPVQETISGKILQW